MHANVHSLHDLFKLGQFEPANIQRDYQWSERQWRVLLDDLSFALAASGYRETADPHDGPEDSEDIPQNQPDPSPQNAKAPLLTPGATPSQAQDAAFEVIPNYYLGHMILMRRKSEGAYFVFDGQQRFLTLTLLLAALRDHIGDRPEAGDVQRVIRDADGLSRVRLKAAQAILSNAVAHLNAAREIAEKGLAGTPIQSRLRECIAFFVKSLRDWPVERAACLSQFLLHRVQITATVMDDRRLAQRAYATINTRGTALEQKDIIKAFLVQRAVDISGNLKDGDRVNRAWTTFESAARKHTDRVVALSMHLHFKKPVANHLVDAVVNQFQDVADIEPIIEWIAQTLTRIWKTYEEHILGPSAKSQLAVPAADIRRMGFLPWWQWQSALIQIIWSVEPGNQSEAIHRLYRWSFIATILDWGEGKVEATLLEAVERIAAGKSAFRSYLDTQGKTHYALQVSRKLRERAASRLFDGQIADNERRGALVRWMETLLGDQKRVDFSATNGTSVEHVLPRNADGQWLQDFPENPQIFSEMFGNLCLVPKKLNSDLENAQYRDKVNGYLALAGVYRSAGEVASNAQWKSEQVKARTARVAERAIRELMLATTANQK